MKRGLVVNSHQSNASPIYSNANCKLDSLLQDYLDLQKENVRRKRKIQSAKRKLETLVQEVRFLRQRYEYLINSQFSKLTSDGYQGEDNTGQEKKGKDDQDTTNTQLIISP